MYIEESFFWSDNLNYEPYNFCQALKWEHGDLSYNFIIVIPRDPVRELAGTDNGWGVIVIMVSCCLFIHHSI